MDGFNIKTKALLIVFAIISTSKLEGLYNLGSIHVSWPQCNKQVKCVAIISEDYITLRHNCGVLTYQYCYTAMI